MLLPAKSLGSRFCILAMSVISQSHISIGGFNKKKDHCFDCIIILVSTYLLSFLYLKLSDKKVGKFHFNIFLFIYET